MFRLLSAVLGAMVLTATANACPPALAALGQCYSTPAQLPAPQTFIQREVQYVPQPAQTIIQREVQTEYIPPQRQVIIQRDVTTDYCPPAQQLFAPQRAPAYYLPPARAPIPHRSYLPPQRAVILRDPGPVYLPPARGTTIHHDVLLDPGHVVRQRDVIHHGGLFHPRRDVLRSRTTIH